MNTNKLQYLQNKEGQDIFLIQDEINKNYYCGECSRILYDARHCEFCRETYCKYCSMSRDNTCCDEELTETKKLAEKINNMRCKCIICNEEMFIKDTPDHPQSKNEHVYDCEGCQQFKEVLTLLYLHHQQCPPYLIKQIEALNDRIMIMENENGEMSKRMKTKDEEMKKLATKNNLLKIEVDSLNEKAKNINENILISQQHYLNEIANLNSQILICASNEKKYKQDILSLTEQIQSLKNKNSKTNIENNHNKNNIKDKKKK
eukprot:TRINITY_DN4012_c2_g1_i1.p1 TRINITY_DN4012_c2_g1~~TRINITY_DN4012_c2_g1_i1.p1  ORF type:complete len:261 (+),score=82.07 TRINITY_DN4012_c2_g1_i1:59-841(+)